MSTPGRHYDAVAEANIVLLKQVQREYGMCRFRQGVLLKSIKDNGYWQGRSQSFSEFLEEEQINESAARQYMTVAAKLIELELTEKEIEELACVSMSTLEKACAVMNKGNYREILDLVSVLAPRDARHELDLIRNPVPAGRRDPKVTKLLNTFRSLPHELRVETMGSLGVHHKIAVQGKSEMEHVDE